MPLNWNTVVTAVRDKLRSGIPYANVEIVGGIEEYIAGQTSQAINTREFLILLSRPNGDHRSAEPMFSGLHLKRYDILIALAAKTNPSTVNRVLGKDKKGTNEVEDAIYSLLEHDNLGGLCDNKAGTNFEGGWTQLPIDSKAFTCTQTLYSCEKTER